MKTTQQQIDEIQKSYDEVPYMSHPIRESHPYHLQAMCQLVGLKTPDYRKAKVLEIGCSFGGNIIPMAIHNPEMEIIGVDLSEFQINEGKKIIEAVGLYNIKLIQADISKCDIEPNHFDYIICHGVFSWVPEAVQHAILALIQKGLKDDGVAYVSYNTYPGWKITENYREAMMFATSGIENSDEKYQKAMEMLDFLKENMVACGVRYDLVEKGCYQRLKESEEYYIKHEYLEGINKPLYFYQFANMLKDKNLTYVTDADFHISLPTLSKSIEEECVYLEQMFDFTNNTSFRRGIITKSNNPKKDNICYRNRLLMQNFNNLYIKSIIKKYDNVPLGKCSKTIIDYLTNNEGCHTVLDVFNTLKSTQSIDEEQFYKTICLLLMKRSIILLPYFINNTNKKTERPYIKDSLRTFANIRLENNQLNYINKYHYIVPYNPAIYLIASLLNGDNNATEIYGLVKDLLIIDKNNKIEHKDEDLSLMIEKYVEEVIEALIDFELTS